MSEHSPELVAAIKDVLRNPESFTVEPRICLWLDVDLAAALSAHLFEHGGRVDGSRNPALLSLAHRLETASGSDHVHGDEVPDDGGRLVRGID